MSTQAQHSGEELLRGLSFGYGPVADKYPDLLAVSVLGTLAAWRCMAASPW